MSTTGDDSQTDEDPAEDRLTPAVNDWVAVAYESGWFPGQVQEPLPGQPMDTSLVKFMHKKSPGQGLWDWPAKEDKESVPNKFVLMPLNAPVKQCHGKRELGYKLQNAEEAEEIFLAFQKKYFWIIVAVTTTLLGDTSLLRPILISEQPLNLVSWNFSGKSEILYHCHFLHFTDLSQDTTLLGATSLLRPIARYSETAAPRATKISVYVGEIRSMFMVYINFTPHIRHVETRGLPSVYRDRKPFSRDHAGISLQI